MRKLIMMAEIHPVPSHIFTPLYATRNDTFLKCEFLHPGRSHKARVARALVDDAERRGEIGPRRRRTLLERTGEISASPWRWRRVSGVTN